MPTQKRRVVYLSDEAWEAAKRQGKPFRQSISAYIESLIVGGRIIPQALIDEFNRVDADRPLVPARKAQQAERDRILRKINRGG